MAEELVPDISARQNAVPAMQPYLNAFPLPTYGVPDDVATGISQFKASCSNSTKLDAYSLRIDHRLDDKRVRFGRYSYSPSTPDQRGKRNAEFRDAIASNNPNSNGRRHLGLFLLRE
jgi:hypothetical protein